MTTSQTKFSEFQNMDQIWTFMRDNDDQKIYLNTHTAHAKNFLMYADKKNIQYR